MQYPAKFTPDHQVGGYVVTFPGAPEALNRGDTLEQAKAIATQALELAPRSGNLCLSQANPSLAFA